MYYSFDELEFIPQVSRLKLASAGIDNTDELLKQATTPRDRETLSRKVGLSLQELTRLAGIADLLRIKGVGPSFANSIIASGAANNIQQFLEIMGVKRALKQAIIKGRISEHKEVIMCAESLTNALHSNRIYSSRRLPSASELAEAAEEATELRPRLIISKPGNDQEYKNIIEESRRKYNRIELIFQ